MRRLVAILATAILATVAAPADPAHAARVTTLTATLTVDLWDDVVVPAQRVDLWAPAALPCGAQPCPVLDASIGVHLSSPGLCVIEDSAAPLQTACTIEGFEVVLSPLVGLGPWCGVSSAPNMEVKVTVGATTHTLVGLLGVHTGPAMVWQVVREGNPGQLNNVGAGVATVTGMHHVDGAGAVQDASCGLLKPDFRPTNRLDLALQVVWSDPT